MTDPERPPRWVLLSKTRRHTTYRATTNGPGIALFLLIALLGAVALGVAWVHYRHLHALARDDAVLGGIGIAMLALGLIQIARLR